MESDRALPHLPNVWSDPGGRRPTDPRRGIGRGTTGKRRSVHRKAPTERRSPADVACGDASAHARVSTLSGHSPLRHRAGPAEVTRVAAVDLGTNSTRLLVADVDESRVATVVQRL